MLLQKQVRKQHLHHFYEPLQYDVRGRGVGTNSPVLPPSECPEMDATIPDVTNDVPLKDSNTKLKKKTKTKFDKKDKLQRPKGTMTSDSMSKVNKYDSDDDLSFVEIEKPSTGTFPSSTAASVVSKVNDQDIPFGSISTQNPLAPPDERPTNAPTTTNERLATQYGMSRQGGNGGTSTVTIEKHSPAMKAKSKKGIGS